MIFQRFLQEIVIMFSHKKKKCHQQNVRTMLSEMLVKQLLVALALIVVHSIYIVQLMRGLSSILCYAHA